MEAPPLRVLFVYGTLKRGGSNHHALADQRFLGAARTAPGYTLIVPADYPGLICAPSDHAGVTGEIWTVSPDCLQTLDQLEGVDVGLYQRNPIELATPHHNFLAETYFYLPPSSNLPRIGSTWIEPRSG